MSHYVERPRFSCALGGALETITSLPDTIPIIHAASGCGGNLFAAQQAGGFYGSGYCGGLSMPSSNVSENEIIFGGDDRLKEQIQSTLEILEAKLFVVVTGCMTEIIGDDPKAVANQFRNQEKTIVVTNTGGFRGNSYKGYDLVLQTLFTDYVPKTTIKIDKLVNIWGIVPGHDPFFRGDLEEIKRLLKLLGIRANTFFSYDETLENLYTSAEASLNLIFSRVYGIEAAKTFQEKHGTAYVVEDIPVGPSATEEFLYRIAGHFGIQTEIVTQAVTEEKSRYYRYIERVSDSYLDGDLQQYAIVISNSNYYYSFTRFLADDLGWIPELTVITDDLAEEQKETLREAFKDFETIKAPKLVFETDTSQIQARFTEGRQLYSDDRYVYTPSPLIVLGSTQDIDLADELKAKSLSVSYPIVDRAVLDKGYAGFRGGLHLFEDLLEVLLRGVK